MSLQAFFYFAFGLSMTVCLIVIIAFYYSKKRHDHVEKAKYKMMDDD